MNKGTYSRTGLSIAVLIMLIGAQQLMKWKATEGEAKEDALKVPTINTQEEPSQTDSNTQTKVYYQPKKPRREYVDQEMSTADESDESSGEELKFESVDLGQVIPASSEVIGEGQRLMEGFNDGQFPHIVVDYREHLGFENYRNEMENLGGKFFVVEKGKGKLLWEVKFETGSLAPVASHLGLTSRTRVIRDEVAVRPVLEKARSKKSGKYDIVLLIPSRLEACLLGALQRGISQRNMHVNEFKEFAGKYTIRNGKLALEFTEGRASNGKTYKLAVCVPI